MTRQRVIVALVVLPALYLYIRYLPPSAFFALVCASVLVGQYEFYRFFSASLRPWLLAAGLFFGVLIVWSLYQQPGRSLLVINDGAHLTMAAVMACLVMGMLLAELWFGRALASSLTEVSVLVFGALYVGGLLGHLVLLRGLVQGAGAVFFVVAVTWMVDSAAYFGGRRFGRHPLAPVISPKKTIEGAVIGLAGGLTTALVAQWWWFPMLTVAESVGVGLLLGCVGQLGDLAESMLKRSAGVKDSGGWIPAHGGLLDKVDSLVFTAPTFYYYLVWVKDYGRLIM
jgi:phosphatidate cytidylyltransferase